MQEKQVRYILIGLALVIALVGSYFGVTLPYPAIPPVAPTATPVSLAGLVTHEELALVQQNIEAWQVAPDGARSFSVGFTPCYQEFDGSEWIAGSGCTWTMESGSTLDIQSGATVNLPAVSAGHTTITGNLVVSGTSNLVGNVSSSTGAVTVTDGLVVTGVADMRGTLINSGGTLTVADHLDVANTLNYSTANLYPVGAEDSNFQWSWGSDTITGTLAVTHKVGTPTAAWCSLAQNPVNAEGALCSTLIGGSTVTVSVWLSTAAASAVGVDINWLIIGLP